MSPTKQFRLSLSLAAVLVCLPRVALSCPFCNAVTRTFSEEINDSHFAVLASLVERPVRPADAKGAENEAVDSTFEIVEVLKGSESLGGLKRFDVLYFGQQPIGAKFLVLGVDTRDPDAKRKAKAKIAWAAPTALSDRGLEYVKALPTLADKGPARLAFFQEYLEDAEAILGTDAYDEFARAPYAEVKQLGPQMHHDRLLDWIKDPNVSPSRRRLYLTMLGVCGQADDVPVLEEMIKSPDRQVRVALDAIIACYLILNGPEGLSLVEDLFFKDEEAEYIDTYSAITALRFLGQESDAVSKDRLMEGLRHILDRPKLADLVIPDLARWHDWSVMDKLVELFKDADDQSSWVRVPVLKYLEACPMPEAIAHLEELAKIDPDAMKRARSFGSLLPAGGSGSSSASQSGADKSTKNGPAKDGRSSGEKAKGEKASGEKGTNEKATGGKTGADDKPSTSKKTSSTESAPDESELATVEGVERGEVAAVPAVSAPRAARSSAGPARDVATTAGEPVGTLAVVVSALAGGGVVSMILLVILCTCRPRAARAQNHQQDHRDHASAGQCRKDDGERADRLAGRRRQVARGCRSRAAACSARCANGRHRGHLAPLHPFYGRQFAFIRC
ncbi:MAG TPA: HEAT repeat domain-containing protein, partial [Pirellulales bacterium]|nr:HEAT repeat domain-containing protein [Pirellulales bacterium]